MNHGKLSHFEEKITTLDRKEDTKCVSLFWGSGRHRQPPPSGISMLRAAEPPSRKFLPYSCTRESNFHLAPPLV